MNHEQATKAWLKNFRGLIFFLSELQDVIANKCRDEQSKRRVSGIVKDLLEDLRNIEAHLRAYAAHHFMHHSKQGTLSFPPFIY